MPYRTIPENRIAKLKKTSIVMDGDCWMWTGPSNPGGYGTAAFEGQKTTAHRVLYQLIKGPIPEGMDLDHLCRNRLCVNPEHLEPVTRGENLTRGFMARGCRNGHPATDDNISIVRRSDGSVELRCKICHRARNAAAKRRRTKLGKFLRAG
jgi:hypothetical protein